MESGIEDSGDDLWGANVTPFFFYYYFFILFYSYKIQPWENLQAALFYSFLHLFPIEDVTTLQQTMEHQVTHTTWEE